MSSADGGHGIQATDSDQRYSSTTTLSADERARLKERLMLEWRAYRKDTFHNLRVENFNLTNTVAEDIAVKRRAFMYSERDSLSDRYLPKYFRLRLQEHFCLNQRRHFDGRNGGVRSLSNEEPVNSHGNYPSRHLRLQVAEERRRQAAIYQKQRESLVHFHSTQKDDNLSSIIETPKSAEHVLALKSLFMSWARDSMLLAINGDDAPDIPELIDKGIAVSNTHRQLNGAPMLFMIPGSCNNDYWGSDSRKWAELVFDWLDILGCLQDPIDAAISASQDEEAFQKKEADARLKVEEDANNENQVNEDQRKKEYDQGLLMSEKRREEKKRKIRTNRPLFITMSDWIILTCCDLIKDWEMVATMRSQYDTEALNRRRMVAEYNVNCHRADWIAKQAPASEWSAHSMLEALERARMSVQPKLMRQRQIEGDRLTHELLYLERRLRGARAGTMSVISRLRLAFHEDQSPGAFKVPPMLGCATTLQRPQSASLRRPQSASLRRPQSASLRRPQSASLHRPESARHSRPKSAASKRPHESTPTSQQRVFDYDEEDEKNKYRSAKKNINTITKDRELFPEEIFREASKLLSCGLCTVEPHKKEPVFTVRTKEYTVVETEGSSKSSKANDNIKNIYKSLSSNSTSYDSDFSSSDNSGSSGSSGEHEKVSNQAESSIESRNISHNTQLLDVTVEEKNTRGATQQRVLLPYTASVPPLTFSVALLLLLPHRFKMYLVKSNIRFYPTLAPDIGTGLSDEVHNGSGAVMSSYDRRRACRFYGAITPGGRAAVIQTRNWLKKINDPEFSERWKNKVVVMKKREQKP